MVDLIVNDAGLGSEAIDILVGFLISDTGAGSDLAGRLFDISVSDSATAREIISLLVLKLSQMEGNLSTLQSKLYNKATLALYNKDGSLKTGGSSLFTKR